MKGKIPDVLEECLARVAKGESVESCLAEHEDLRAELEPLLRTAQAVAGLPRVSPSQQFKQSARARLMARINSESEAKLNHRAISAPSRGFLSRFTDNLGVRIAVPVALAVVAALVIWLTVPPAVRHVPSRVQAAEITLTNLQGNAEVFVNGGAGWQSGQSGLTLVSGDRVRTDAETCAVLTFVNGSTAKLEPDTAVKIVTSEYINEGSASIHLEQEQGTVWNYVQADVLATDYVVFTPAARIVAHGTSFTTVVESGGATRVNTVDGIVTVEGAGSRVQLAKNQKTEVRPASPPDAPQERADDTTELVFSTASSAVSSVIDPTGSSTGLLPNGISFSQITNSSMVLTASGQQIGIGEPRGEYTIVVRSLPQISVQISFQIKKDGKIVAEHTQILSANDEGAWLMRLNMSPGPASAGALSPLAVSEAEPLGSNRPEKVVETELAKAAATPLLNTAVVKPGASGTAATPGQATHPATPSQRPTKTTHTPNGNPSPTPGGTPPIVKPSHTPGPPSTIPPVTPGVPPTPAPTVTKPAPKATVEENPTPPPTDTEKPKPSPKPSVKPKPNDEPTPTNVDTSPTTTVPTSTVDPSPKPTRKSVPSATVEPTQLPASTPPETEPAKPTPTDPAKPGKTSDSA